MLSPFFLDPDTSNALVHFMGLPPKILLGIILALYPLSILIGGSFIGTVSDNYGRKPVLIISLLLAAGGYTLTGYAISQENYLLFALARVLVTHKVSAIGERRKPQPNGQPGYSRVDTVHQAIWTALKGFTTVTRWVKSPGLRLFVRLRR